MVEHLSSLPKALGLILQNHPKNYEKREKKGKGEGGKCRDTPKQPRDFRSQTFI